MKIQFDSAIKEITNFFVKENLIFETDLMDSIISFLPSCLSYEEEGEPIKPNIIIGSSIRNSLLLIPNKYILRTKKEKFIKDKFFKNLKSLIPFCKNGWYIYIDYNDNSDIEFGIIKGFTGPKGLSIKDIIQNDIEPEETSLITLETINKYEILLTGLSRATLNVDFRILHQHSNDLSSVLKDLSLDIVKDLSFKHEELNQSIINTWNIIYRRVHGTICYIVNENYDQTTPLTKDGVWLEKPIELGKTVAEIIESQKSIEITTSEKYYSLNGLLIEMLNTDGITVIDTEYRILGYNIFVRPSDDLLELDIAGGARKRAAHFLLHSKNENAVGVYFQSQDGDAFYERIDNE